MHPQDFPPRGLCRIITKGSPIPLSFRQPSPHRCLRGVLFVPSQPPALWTWRWGLFPSSPQPFSNHFLSCFFAAHAISLHHPLVHLAAARCQSLASVPVTDDFISWTLASFAFLLYHQWFLLHLINNQH